MAAGSRFRGSEGGFAVFVVADSNGFVDAGDEDLAVADFAGACGADDGGDGLFSEGVGDDNFNFDLGQEIDGVFPAAVELGVAFLATVASGFEDGHAFDSGFEERVFDGIQLGGLEDGFDLLHTSQILARVVLAVADSSVSGWWSGMGIPRIAQYSGIGVGQETGSAGRAAWLGMKTATIGSVADGGACVGDFTVQVQCEGKAGRGVRSWADGWRIWGTGDAGLLYFYWRF